MQRHTVRLRGLEDWLNNLDALYIWECWVHVLTVDVLTEAKCKLAWEDHKV